MLQKYQKSFFDRFYEKIKNYIFTTVTDIVNIRRKNILTSFTRDVTKIFEVFVDTFYEVVKNYIFTNMKKKYFNQLLRCQKSHVDMFYETVKKRLPLILLKKHAVLFLVDTSQTALSINKTR